MKAFFATAVFVISPLFTHYAFGLPMWFTFAVWALGVVAIGAFLFALPRNHVRDAESLRLDQEALQV